MRVVKAPERFRKEPKEVSVFLAGSIEMGKARKWQDEATELLSYTAPGDPVIPFLVLNPRRDDWDSSWEQKYENLQFREQVQWELKNINDADWMIVYFDPKTNSPITLLELGMRKWDSSRTVVVCPQGYFRKGNVDIFCDVNDIHQTDTLEEAISFIKKSL